MKHELFYRLNDDDTTSVVSNLTEVEVGKRIALDSDIGGSGIDVSTVFLGIDHSIGSSKPVLFESMVFGGKNDGDCRRYSTVAEAREGHRKLVTREWRRVVRQKKGASNG